MSSFFEDRQQNTRETLEKLKEIIKEINAAQKEQAEKAMSSEVFTVYWMLKEEGLLNAEALANSLQEVFAKYPYWHNSERYEREIRRSLYKALTQAGIQDVTRIPAIAQNIIKILKTGQAAQ